MEPYILTFATITLFNAALVYHRSYRQKYEAYKAETESLALPDAAGKEAANKFKAVYFSVYVLAVAADWLQGPYMYTLYKDQKGLEEGVVAALFTTGFVSAAISASFVGHLADQYGRRSACLSYCIVYSLSCLSTLSSDPLLLFGGRALGGVSTTLLFSVFETWMVAEYSRQELQGSLKLGDMFSTSVTLSGVTAIVCGVAGEVLVEYSGTKTAPFMAAVGCLVGAGCVMWHYWPENYGTISHEKAQSAPKNLRTALSDKRILTLTTVTAIFEGSMYLFVFFWSPAIKAARASSTIASTHDLATDPPPVPFGLIFSNFMSSMMFGSLLCSILPTTTRRETNSLLLCTLALAATALLLPVLTRPETLIFWAFALFEVCVGMYFPLMSRLKSEFVQEEVRGKVYGFMRIPLNLFVVVALGLTREGEAYRNSVFTAAGALLLVSFGVAATYLD